MAANYKFCDDTAGIVDVPGFKASGVHCDVRGKGDPRLDLAIVYSERPCTAAGTFTTNDVKAAPVRLCMEQMRGSGPWHAIVANSGNANACTGDQGAADAQEMVDLAAKGLGISQSSVFVCSTGRIGELMPMGKIRSGISNAIAQLGDSHDHGRKSAHAILTSDTRPKTATATFEYEGQTIVVAGFAKGAGMIQPNMATMLAFVGTNLGLDQETARGLLLQAVQGTFNRVSVDGDMSTNDTVLLLANGESGIHLGEYDGDLLTLFQKALHDVCYSLASKIVGDGERITKVVRLQVRGAHNQADAEKVCRAIGNSLLVKTSWFGGDPNWGRILHAAGYARVGLQEERIDLHYGDIPVIQQGNPIPSNKPRWKAEVAQKYFTILLDLHLGSGSFEMLCTDLTEGYVNFNKSE